MASAITIKGTLADTLLLVARQFQPGRIEMQFIHFAHEQYKFRGFNFHKWLSTCEKCENKCLTKITTIR